MKIYQLVLVIIAIFLLCFGASLFVYSKTSILEVKDIPFNISVGENAGFIADATVPLQFGTTVPGGGSRRWVNITNTHEFPLRIIGTAHGEAGAWFEEHSKVIQPGEKFDFQLRLIVPKDTSYGDYTGTIRIHMVKD